MDAATAITNQLYRYADLVDAGDFAGIGALLADALVTDASGALEIRGAEAVTKLYEGTTRRYPDTGTPKTKHLVTNPIVEIDDAAGTATCKAHYTVLQATPDLPLQPIIAGHYEQRYERRGEAWRIVEHRFFVDLVGNVGEHLLMELA